MKNIILLAIFLLLLSGCSRSNRIEEEKFIQVYTDLVIAQDTSRASAIEMDSVREMIYSRYNITKDEYRETIDYYNAKPERWEAFFNEVILHIEKKQQEEAAGF
jgi:protein-tyrosine-phosphatase